jgi:hypothetical protein
LGDIDDALYMRERKRLHALLAWEASAAPAILYLTPAGELPLEQSAAARQGKW